MRSATHSSPHHSHRHQRQRHEPFIYLLDSRLVRASHSIQFASIAAQQPWCKLSCPSSKCGEVLKAAVDTNSICSAQRAYMHIIPNCCVEFGASWRRYALQLQMHLIDDGSPTLDAAEAARTDRLKFLHGKADLADDLLRTYNHKKGQLKHPRPAGSNMQVHVGHKHGFLCELVLLVEDKLVLTRLGMFSSCVEPILRMFIMGML